MVDDSKLKNYYDVALKYVLKCGPLMRDGYEKAQANYKVKSDFYDLVTVYDKQIEDLLVKNLKAAFPDSEFIGEEESAETKRTPVLTDAPTWIIDPIDGTTNFIHKIPHCCISLGLAVAKELVVGIVYNPIANEMYSAWKGHGAYLNGQRINVTNCELVNNAVIAYEISLIHNKQCCDKNLKRLYKLASNATGTRCMGSAALTLCYVASGSFDSYHVEDLKPWDLAAGAVILLEAGGFLSNTTGGPFDVMKPDLIAAATETLAKNVMELIREADQITDYTFR